MKTSIIKLIGCALLASLLSACTPSAKESETGWHGNSYAPVSNVSNLGPTAGIF